MALGDVSAEPAAAALFLVIAKEFKTQGLVERWLSS